MAVLLCLCFVAGILVVALWRPSNRPLSRGDADRLVQIAIADAHKGRMQPAYDSLQRILTAFPDHHPASVEKAMLCIHLRRGAEASATIAAIPNDYLKNHFEISWKLAKLMSDSGLLFEAEPFLERLLVLQPGHAPTRRELLRCFRISGENAAASEYLAAALWEPKLELRDLLMATAPLTNWATPADVQFMKSVGQQNFDPLTMLGYARRLMQSGQSATAVDVLRRIVVQKPNWEPAIAQLAIVNWQLGREDDWRKIMSTWDPAKLDHPNSWFIWGVWQVRQEDYPSAVRCFGEALERDPKHAGAASQMIVPLRKLGQEASAGEWTAYVEQLAQLDQACLSVGLFEQAPDDVKAIAEWCEELGWHREARAWYRFSQQTWPERNIRSPTDDANQSESLTDANDLPQRRLVEALEFRKFPLPERIPQQKSIEIASTGTSMRPAQWRLDNDAAQLGIDFRFHNGLPDERPQGFMFEFAGPGIGILDYDNNGWPDLELTQGAPWPVQEGVTTLRDELFRNLGDGTFTPVSAAAGLDDPGYSQGPAVGDLNGDSF
ncbi:MAG: hypothetical protein B7Z55_04220, partial [Planctomycetales bacterium 12-60-4]